MKYYVTIGTREFEIVIHGDDVSVNGQRVEASIEDVAGSPLHSLRIGSDVHQLLARRGADRTSWDISLGGHRFAVEALDARSRAIRSLSGGAGKASGPAPLLAPMPGLIVRVSVTEGSAVQPGQGLVVMEAMKMENELRASVAGVVKRVAVTVGSAVEKGTLLLELE